MALESKAFFTARLVKLGLDAPAKSFASLGWTTMAEFAFAANYKPGATDETSFIKDIVVPLYTSEDSIKKSALRRLYFEAYTMAAADVHRRAVRPDDEEKPKKMPIVERAERFSALEKIVGGLTLRNELEPSWTLTDKFVEMEDSGEMRYIKWEECTLRSQEIQGVKKDDYWEEDSSGRMQKFSSDPILTVGIGDLLSLKNLLQRRGLAMHMAKLLSFSVHEQLVNFYFNEMNREKLPGHGAVTVDQVRNADKEIFFKIVDQTRNGLTALGDSLADPPVFPLDVMVPKILVEPRVLALMMPYRVGNRAPGAGSSQGGNKRHHDEGAVTVKPNKKHKASGDKGGGKGKGRGGKKHSGPPLPSELRGMTTVFDGRKLCFDYNMHKGCSTSGQEGCPKGLHRCMFPGCGERHGLPSCEKKGR